MDAKDSQPVKTNTVEQLQAMSTEQLLELAQHYSNEAARLSSYQLALKILLNSLYGALGNSSFRYFNVSLASSVTTSGRQAIRWIERKLNELIDAKTGIKKDRVVLIDTDSVVLDLNDVVTQVCPADMDREQKLKFLDVLGEKVLHPYIAQSYDELGDYMNAYEHRFKMKRENIINSMVSVAAKSYVMEVYNREGVQYTLEHPYMKIMGLQLVKSSTPAVIRNALRNALPIMLHGDERQLQQYVEQQRELYKNFTVEQIAFPRAVTSLGKNDPVMIRQVAAADPTNSEKQALLENIIEGNDIYTKKTPIHVRASLIHNYLLDKYELSGDRKKIADGDNIKFVYLKLPNPIHEDVIGFQDTLPDQFNVRQYVDYDKMFEKTFISTIEKMIEPLGWSPVKTNTLSDWFM